jgi:hypothetical protein
MKEQKMEMEASREKHRALREKLDALGIQIQQPKVQVAEPATMPQSNTGDLKEILKGLRQEVELEK